MPTSCAWWRPSTARSTHPPPAGAPGAPRHRLLRRAPRAGRASRRWRASPPRSPPSARCARPPLRPSAAVLASAASGCSASLCVPLEGFMSACVTSLPCRACSRMVVLITACRTQPAAKMRPLDFAKHPPSDIVDLVTCAQQAASASELPGVGPARTVQSSPFFPGWARGAGAPPLPQPQAQQQEVRPHSWDNSSSAAGRHGQPAGRRSSCCSTSTPSCSPTSARRSGSCGRQVPRSAASLCLSISVISV